MKLQAWDLQFKNLLDECGDYPHVSQRRKQLLRIRGLQQEIGQHLARLQALSLHNDAFTTHEQAIYRGVSNFAEQARGYYEEFGEVLCRALWARLQYPSTERMRRMRTKLEQDLRLQDKELRSLQSRYEQLGVLRAMRAASKTQAETINCMKSIWKESSGL